MHYILTNNRIFLRIRLVCTAKRRTFATCSQRSTDMLFAQSRLELRPQKAKSNIYCYEACA